MQNTVTQVEDAEVGQHGGKREESFCNVDIGKVSGLNDNQIDRL